MSVEGCRGVALLTVMLLLVLFSVVAIYAAEDLDMSIARSTHLRQSEQAFQIASGDQFLDEQARHDRFSSAGIVR